MNSPQTQTQTQTQTLSRFVLRARIVQDHSLAQDKLRLKPYGEDEAQGEPSLSNGGMLHLNVQLKSGGRVSLDFSRDEIAALVPTIVASAVRVESHADTVERYLREFGDTMTEEQKSLMTGQMEKING